MPKGLLGIEGIERGEIEQILERAMRLETVARRGCDRTQQHRFILCHARAAAGRHDDFALRCPRDFGHQRTEQDQRPAIGKAEAGQAGMGGMRVVEAVRRHAADREQEQA